MKRGLSLLAILLILALPAAALAGPAGQGSGKGGGQGASGAATTTTESASDTGTVPASDTDTVPASDTDTVPASDTDTVPDDGGGKGKGKGQSGSAPGQAVRQAAHQKVAERLQAALDSGKIKNDNARGNMESLISKMLGDLKTAGEATTDEEALAAVEATLEAEVAEEATAAELDVLAEVQKRLGKKDKAKETLRNRLEKNATTLEAYEDLLELEEESGERQDLDTFVGGKKVEFDVRPKVSKKNNTLVPVAALTRALGADVKWDGATRTVTITKGETIIVLTIGSTTALVNGQEVELAEAAAIDGDRTVVPLRFVSENLGLYVRWVAEHRSILLTEQPVEETPTVDESTTDSASGTGTTTDGSTTGN